MEVTRARVDRAKSGEDDHWNFGNEILYHLCRENPSHENTDVVIAKVWLIGRSYAAAVERRRNQSDNQIDSDYFYERHVAPTLINSDLDSKIDALRHLKSIDADAIVPILELHNYLVTLFWKLTNDNKRSLASKYLHFHLPNLFYIYDTRAVQGISLIGPPLSTQSDINGKFDNEYKKLFLKSLDLRDRIRREHEQDLSPRQIDRVLLSIEADDRRAKGRGIAPPAPNR